MQTIAIKKEKVDEILAKTNRSHSDLARELTTSPSYLLVMLDKKDGVTAKFRDKLQDALGVTDWDDLFEVIDDIDESSQPMPL